MPETIRKKISNDLQNLLNLAESDSRKLESYTLAVGGALTKPSNIKVSGVKYGFKAPVAMTLAPFWAYLLSDFRESDSAKFKRFCKSFDIFFRIVSGKLLGS